MDAVVANVFLEIGRRCALHTPVKRNRQNYGYACNRVRIRLSWDGRGLPPHPITWFPYMRGWRQVNDTKKTGSTVCGDRTRRRLRCNKPGGTTRTYNQCTCRASDYQHNKHTLSIDSNSSTVCVSLIRSKGRWVWSLANPRSSLSAGGNILFNDNANAGAAHQMLACPVLFQRSS